MILREVQDEAGHISGQTVTALALALGIPRVRVKGGELLHTFPQRARALCRTSGKWAPNVVGPGLGGFGMLI